MGLVIIYLTSGESGVTFEDKINDLYKQHTIACDKNHWGLAAVISSNMAKLIREEIKKSYDYELPGRQNDHEI